MANQPKIKPTVLPLKNKKVYAVYDREEREVGDIICFFDTEDDANVAANFMGETFNFNCIVKEFDLYPNIEDWIIDKAAQAAAKRIGNDT